MKSFFRHSRRADQTGFITKLRKADFQPAQLRREQRASQFLLQALQQLRIVLRESASEDQQ